MKEKTWVLVPVLTSRQRILTLVAIALVTFFNNGDTAFLSSAAPTILGHLGGAHLYALIFSVKMLTNAICVMLCGKLSDKFGRRNIMLLGVGLVFVGYLGGGFSLDMTQMIIWRAITGIGSGLCLGMVFTMMGDLFTGKAYGTAYLVQMVGHAAALIGGPVLGGLLVTYLPWQWSFWSLVPLAVIAFVLLLLGCPNYRATSTTSKVDSLGMVLFTLAMSTLLLALSLVGSFFAWSSPITIILLVFAAILFVVFFIHEARTDRHIAIFPVTILKNRVVGVSAIGQLCMTINSLCLMSYIPYFVQNGMGQSATTSGNVLSASYSAITACGLIITKRMGSKGNYGFWVRFTVLGESLALILVLVFLKPTMSIASLIALMITYGVFAAVEGNSFIMATQSCLSPARMAVGTSCITFVQAAASVLGSAIGGTILNTSADFMKGITNIFIFASAITVIGAIIVSIFMPSNDRIAQMRQEAIEADAQKEN